MFSAASAKDLYAVAPVGFRRFLYKFSIFYKNILIFIQFKFDIFLNYAKVKRFYSEEKNMEEVKKHSNQDFRRAAGPHNLGQRERGMVFFSG